MVGPREMTTTAEMSCGPCGTTLNKTAKLRSKCGANLRPLDLSYRRCMFAYPLIAAERQSISLVPMVAAW